MNRLVLMILFAFGVVSLSAVPERPDWNRRAVMFQYAPTFEFESKTNPPYAATSANRLVPIDGVLPLMRRLARALGGAILRQQQSGGWIRTHWAWNETPDKIWMNCHVASALALLELSSFD